MKVKLTYLEHLNGCFTVSLHCLSECFDISCNRVKRQRSGKAFYSVTKLLRLRSITSTWHASSECQNYYMSSVSRASSLYSHIHIYLAKSMYQPLSQACKNYLFFKQTWPKQVLPYLLIASKVWGWWHIRNVIMSTFLSFTKHQYWK